MSWQDHTFCDLVPTCDLMWGSASYKSLFNTKNIFNTMSLGWMMFWHCTLYKITLHSEIASANSALRHEKLKILSGSNEGNEIL